MKGTVSSHIPRKTARRPRNRSPSSHGSRHSLFCEHLGPRVLAAVAADDISPNTISVERRAQLWKSHFVTLLCCVDGRPSDLIDHSPLAACGRFLSVSARLLGPSVRCCCCPAATAMAADRRGRPKVEVESFWPVATQAALRFAPLSIQCTSFQDAEQTSPGPSKRWALIAEPGFIAVTVDQICLRQSTKASIVAMNAASIDLIRLLPPAPRHPLFFCRRIVAVSHCGRSKANPSFRLSCCRRPLGLRMASRALATAGPLPVALP